MSGLASERELTIAEEWFAESFSAKSVSAEEFRFPVSFRYGGRESASILKDWAVQRATGPSREGARVETVTLTDPHTGLQCRCEVTTFADFPAVEWVAYFKNTGQTDTPIIEDIQALDAKFPVEKGRPCRVHHAKGSQCVLDDFAPTESSLPSRGTLEMASVGGRSSDGALPFFNLEMGQDGVIGAIGWTGDWAANFDRDDARIRVRAGMKETHLRLHPGEEIRTPRILLLFWEEDRIRAHNLLRRLVLAHRTPRPGGKELLVPISDSAWGERMEETHIAKIRWLKDNQIPVEYYWIDAGWYGDYEFDPTADTFGIAWAQRVGSWFPNRTTYPNGLKPIGDAARAAGLGFILWVETERVFQGTQLAREHPEWLLGPLRRRGGGNYLLNLGILEARRFVTDLISSLVIEGGVTLYRQDFNITPAPFWAAADAPDRVGMSEIRHIEGLYAFWDELLARHPGLIIDNCASGGRRIDLETISRSVPLWRSDVQCYPGFGSIAMQTQTQGLAPWVPLSTGCCREADVYAFRSALGPGMVTSWAHRAEEMGPSFPLGLVRKLMHELCEVRKYFYGDFYPLVSFSLADDAWAAWQYDRPDLGEGIVLAFRRQNSPFPRMKAALRGLDPEAQYELHSLDSSSACKMTGRELVEEGFSISIDEKPGSALFIYKRIE